MPEKDSKSAVLYFSPESIGRPEGARCGACWKFIRANGSCVEVIGHIVDEEVCGLYVHGKPFTKDPGFSQVRKVSKAEAGYGPGDTHCANCEYMQDPEAAESDCDEVEGTVEGKGCCNEHEHR
jgi:hypothetical protein